MSEAANKRRIIGLFVFAALLMGIIPLWKHMSQEIVSGGPHIQMLVGEDRSGDTAPNGHYVGANFAYRTNGEYEHENIPSLQGLWQLDEPYAKRSVIEVSENTKFVSIFCATGKLRRLPNDILIVRFDSEVVDKQPDSAFDWRDGEVIPYERYGNFYRINDLSPGVYVARTVWDDGVLETGWLLTYG